MSEIPEVTESGIGNSHVAVTWPSETRIVCPSATIESSQVRIGALDSASSRRHRTEGCVPCRSMATSVGGWSLSLKIATRVSSTFAWEYKCPLTPSSEAVISQATSKPEAKSGEMNEEMRALPE